MLHDAIYVKIISPREHQRIIGRLMMQLGILFYKEKRIPYEPLPETMIDENKTSPTPDIILFDNQTKLNKVIIEVTGSAGVKKDFEKVKQLMAEYDVPEGFVYNYDTGTWMKHDLANPGSASAPSFSNVIQYDLRELLK